MKVTGRIYGFNFDDGTIYIKHDSGLTDIQIQKFKTAAKKKVDKMLYPSFWSWVDKVSKKDLVGMYFEVKI